MRSLRIVSIMGGVSHPHDQYPMPSPFAPPPRGRPIWAVAITALMLAAAGGLALWRLAPLSDDATFAPSSTTPMTLPAPTLDRSNGHHAASALSKAHRASGPRWTMRVSPAWIPVDVPNADEEAAWRTPGGFPGRGDIVTVVHEEMSSLNLHQYMKYQRNILGVGITTASHIRTDVSDGQGELRYHMLASGNPVRTLQIVVPTSSGFASAIFVAPATTYPHDVKQVRRYLETLGGR